MKTQLYLLTGFLGAGKTTFLKNFVSLFADKTVKVIVNEFGKEGIDGILLSQAHIETEEIHDGSIFCTCRLDQFEEVLARQVRLGPDIIIVEASGLSDPTNIRKILSQSVHFENVDFRGSICLVDAINFHKVYSTAVACKKQLSIADAVVINKTDLATPAQIDNVTDIVRKDRPDVPVFQTVYGRIDPSWINELSTPPADSGKPALHTADLTLRKYLITVKDTFTPGTLKEFLELFLENTYRIKGFARLGGNVYYVDATGTTLQILPNTADMPLVNNRLVVLSGSALNAKKNIDKAINQYHEYVVSVE
jgi:G3E family GTPase